MNYFLEDWPDLLDGLNREELGKILQEQPISEITSAWGEMDEKQRLILLQAMDVEHKVDLIRELSPPQQEELLGVLSREGLGRILAVMEPDDLVDMTQELPPEVRRNDWNELSDERKSETKFLLKFDKDDAAGLMTPRYAAIRSHLTVAQTLDFVRRNIEKTETVYYLYIVDPLQRLLGVVSLKDLLTAGDDQKISDIMETTVVSVYEDTDQEDTARVIEDYDMIAVPVVDQFNRLLGIVTFDDVIDVIREEQTEDVYKMGALHGEPESYLSSSIFSLFKRRIPWLVILLLAGTVTTNVLHNYESLILGAAFLSLFIPVITQTGGNSGAQSSTLMIRGLATGGLRFRDTARVLLKELAVGCLIGLVTGLVILLRSRFLPPGIGYYQALTIGASLGLVVLFSAVVGALVPLVLDKIGIDPTVASGPLMATVIDVCGLTIYFETARLILGLT